MSPPLLPREKVLKHGIENVSYADLLALVLGTGTRQKSVFEIAHHLSEFIPVGQLFLAETTSEQLSKILSKNQMLKIMACIELGHRALASQKNEKYLDSSQAVFEVVKNLQHAEQEIMRVLYVNARQQLLGQETVAIGSLNTTNIHPREVFSPSLKYRCFGIILVHNHPSGDPQPSQADIVATEQLVEAGQLLGIAVIDHVIVGKNDAYFSMADERLL